MFGLKKIFGANEGVRLASNTAFAYAIRADVLRSLGRRDEAIGDYNKALRLRPDDETRAAVESALAELTGGRFHAH